MSTRRATIQRGTGETDIELEFALDGTGACKVDTGVGFLDHLLAAFAVHGRFDLALRCRGDLEVDDHHTAEDCGIALGEAIDRALGDRTSIRRFGSAYAPLDEALARSVVDLVARPFAVVRLDLRRETIGALATENVGHVLSSCATSGRFCLHATVLEGDNDHHRAEATFKAFGLALRAAVERDATRSIASTKGVVV